MNQLSAVQHFTGRVGSPLCPPPPPAPAPAWICLYLSHTNTVICSRLLNNDCISPLDRETTDSEACDVSEPVKIDKHKGYFSAFWVVLVILILLILVIISIFTASQLVVKNNSELKSEVKKLEKAVTRANYVACNCCSPFQRRCSNAPDGPHQKPENGFTAELAGNVVDSLVRVSTICRGNAMIAQVLKEKKVTISTAVSGNEEITGQGTDDTILDAKDIV